MRGTTQAAAVSSFNQFKLDIILVKPRNRNFDGLWIRFAPQSAPWRRKITKRQSRKMKSFAKFLKDELGATAIEYGLIVTGISLAIVVTVMALGTQLDNTFNDVSTELGTAGP